MPSVRLVLSLNRFLSEVYQRGDVSAFQSRNNIFYFGDTKLASFRSHLLEYQSGNTSSRALAFRIVEHLVSAEDDGRLFFMPNACYLRHNTNIEEHHDAFLNVLSKIKELGVSIPEWDPEQDVNAYLYLFWRWSDMDEFFRGRNVVLWR